MTPEELEAMKKQIDQINAIDDPEHFRPTADAIDKAAAEFATASYGSLPVRSKCFCGCHALVGAVSHPSIACCRPDDTWSPEQIEARAKSGRPLLETSMPYRSACGCPCHTKGVNIRHCFPCCDPDPVASLRRDPGLIRAELLDALEDYSRIFIEKSELEMERCWAVKGIIARVQSGLEFEQADIEMKTANEWIQRYRLLDMRFQEMQMRVNRLILEHGTNHAH